jgi:hypothetical protein
MRAIRSLLALSLVFGLSAFGCSDDTGQTQLDQQVGGDISQVQDGGTPDGPLGDQMVKADAGPPALLTVVINKLTMPADATEYTADLDGDGTKENKFGGINAALVGAGFGLQSDLDSQINDGIIILLFEIFAKALTADPAMSLQFHQGYDTDNDAKDNFSGSETFGLAVTSPSNLILNGAITGGKMDVGPGNLTIPIPMGATSLMVDLKKGLVTGDVSATGMTAGQINGAIPDTDVDTKIIPAMATLVDLYYKSSQTPPATVLILKALFDGNADGKITADEIRNNALLKPLLAPDVDTDKDGTKDALSIGFGFTAVTCSINK